MAWWPPVVTVLRRAQERCLPFPFPFVPSTSDTRHWDCEILPPAVRDLKQLLGDRLEASLHRILIEAGIAMTPATTVWDPRSWYGLFKYGASFAGTAPRLRLYSGASDLDPRLTGVLAEEVACGISCWLLREHLGFDHIADVYPLIRSGHVSYVDTSDERLRPDYLCVDSAFNAVFAESKGAVGTRASLRKGLSRGWQQVNNVVSNAYRLRDKCGRVVIGTHFCIEDHHPRSETTTVLQDPDGPRGEDRPDDDMAIRVAYAKSMRFAGLDLLADTLMLRESPPPLDLQVIVLDEMRFVLLGVSVFGGAVAIYTPVLEALVNASVVSLRESIPSALDGFRDRRQALTGGYALPNGLAILPLAIL